MRLPNAEHAVIDELKLYLLNTAHPVGGSKAAFFLHFGFVADPWQVLAAARGLYIVATIRRASSPLIHYQNHKNH
ncbi:MAG: DUF6883 domain-containing protein [Candidatus Methylacidiphilales bacterium]